MTSISLMKLNKVLVTCPPMLGMIDRFVEFSKENHNIELIPKKVAQTMSENDLIKIIKDYDGWIIGDDPASAEVFREGKKGKLKAAVKWGVGIDNVDMNAAEDLKIKIKNTPGMFGDEVADLAHCYLVCLSRNVIGIHNGVIKGEWPKHTGHSLRGSTVAIVGYGDIGRCLLKRVLASEMNIQIYDPFINSINSEDPRVKKEIWPNNLSICDFIILTCSLNSSNYHLLDEKIFNMLKNKVKIINVSRGPLINEEELVKNLERGRVDSVALDVFEKEPLPLNSELRRFNNCIFGSHNASNTSQAVEKTSYKAIALLDELINEY